MSVVLLVAFLLDSACAAACLPGRLETRAAHCAPEKSDAGCDQHGHLKPAVKIKGPATEAPAPVAVPVASIDVPVFAPISGLDPVLHVPPLLKRSTVLRI